MKKLLFVFVLVAVCVFYIASNNEICINNNSQIVVLAEEQGDQQSVGEESSEGEEEQTNPGSLKIGEITIEGFWYWAAFALGLFTLGFYTIRMVSSYKKNKQ